MRELSLHILDIAQNSISANASLVQIIIEENTAEILLISRPLSDFVENSEKYKKRIENIDNAHAISQIRDLMCSSIGFLIGELHTKYYKIYMHIQLKIR